MCVQLSALLVLACVIPWLHDYCCYYIYKLTVCMCVPMCVFPLYLFSFFTIITDNETKYGENDHSIVMKHWETLFQVLYIELSVSLLPLLRMLPETFLEMLKFLFRFQAKINRYRYLSDWLVCCYASFRWSRIAFEISTRREIGYIIFTHVYTGIVIVVIAALTLNDDSKNCIFYLGSPYP